MHNRPGTVAPALGRSDGDEALQHTVGCIVAVYAGPARRDDGHYLQVTRNLLTLDQVI